MMTRFALTAALMTLALTTLTTAAYSKEASTRPLGYNSTPVALKRAIQRAQRRTSPVTRNALPNRVTYFAGTNAGSTQQPVLEQPVLQQLVVPTARNELPSKSAIQYGKNFRSHRGLTKLSAEDE